MIAVLLLNRMNTRRSISVRKRSSRNENILSQGPENIYCRTCLSKKDLVAIFYSKETEEKRSKDLKLVTGLEIKINDGLSQKICTTCVEIINTALQFRKSSSRAERVLISMIQQKTVAKNTKTVKPKCEEKIDDYYDYGDNFQDYSDYTEDVKPVIKKNKTRRSRQRSNIPLASLYKCNTCSKEFRMRATYKAHMRFHTNFCVCEACGKRCRNNNQLQEHKRARHGLGRIHKCAYCEYSSATKEALTIHERRHTGERPYICDHCGATFHRRSNLVQHIAIHLPDKNFQCDMCPKRLKSKKFLQIHKHNAHTGKRYGYLCGICEHRFEKPNKVRAHTRRVHGVPDEHQGPIARIQL